MKKLIKIFSLIMVACILTASLAACWKDNDNKSNDKAAVWDGTIATGYAGGDGSEENPYQIANGMQLALLSKNIFNEVENADSAFYKLTNNIDLNNLAWQPIGGNELIDSKTKFNGVFEGNNKTISKMKIIFSQSSPFFNFGLFGCIENAVIKNLNIENSSIDIFLGNNADTVVGILAGHATQSGIINCNVISSSINNTLTSCSGGLVGFAKDCIIIKCSAESVISIELISYSKNNVYVGGLIGFMQLSLVADSFSYGVININEDDSTSHNYTLFAGGITGKTTVIYENEPEEGGCILNCFSRVDINYERIYDNCLIEANIGGVAGWAKDSLMNNYYAGTITIIDETDKYFIGGTFGQCFETEVDFYGEQIELLIQNNFYENRSGISFVGKVYDKNDLEITVPESFGKSFSIEQMKSQGSGSLLSSLNAGAIAIAEELQYMLEYYLSDALWIDFINRVGAENIVVRNWKIDSKVNDGYPVFNLAIRASSH